MAKHKYDLAVTWDRNSTMIGVDPSTGRKTFYVEGTDRGHKITIEPKHHFNKLYQSVCFGPDIIENDNEVSLNGQSIGTAKFSNVPLDEWPNAASDPELGAGYGVIGHVDLDTDDPFIMSMWPNIKKWEGPAADKEADEVDKEIKRDQDMTAKTPVDSQININDTITRAQQQPETGTWSDMSFLRSWMFGEADSQGITIYTQRWPGKEDGYDWTTPIDAHILYNALVNYMRKNKNK